MCLYSCEDQDGNSFLWAGRNLEQAHAADGCPDEVMNEWMNEVVIVTLYRDWAVTVIVRPTNHMLVWTVS